MRSIVVALVVLLGSLMGVESRTCVCGATAEGGDVNVRTCPSTDCTVIGLISPGDCADYQGTEGIWFRVTFNGQTAYIHSDYVSGPQECGGGTYCTHNPICSSFGSNGRRGCDGYGCGNYGASRDGGTRIHTGWDIPCNGGATVDAPFAGTVVREAFPYGDGSCCDTGFLIDGTGTFAGHSVMIFYANPDRVNMPATVSKGQAVATHTGLHCGCYGASMTDHIHYQVDYFGTRIDPASWRKPD
jgi:murein DD-endopeptidase MepM/ murein hydrolase activator NlpD